MAASSRHSPGWVKEFHPRFVWFFFWGLGVDGFCSQRTSCRGLISITSNHRGPGDKQLC